jgi:hypothetical protein
MDNKMHQDEFEQFLQEEVKQHRMYPSDHIWKNIRMELHGDKAWPALSFISLFIISALTVSTLLNNHPAQLVSRSSVSVAAPHRPDRSNSPMAVNNAAPDKNYFEKIAPEQITSETFADLNENRVIPEEALVANTFSDNAVMAASSPISTERSGLAEKIISTQSPLSAYRGVADITPLTAQVASAKEPYPTVAITTRELPAAEDLSTKTEYNTPQTKTEAHPRADDFLKEFPFISNTAPRNRNSKFGFQFYVTPSTSYRRLSDEKVKEIIQPAVAATTSQNVPLSPNYSAYSTDVNNVVRHRPAIGMELGFAILYNMTNNLKFKTGVQLNIRQYYIETFQSLTNDLTSLSLINYAGVETISFYSPYNNNTGYRQTQLENKVYQVSVPIGIQWEMIQGKHFGINTEASVQPTLTLNNNTYLLSTDYKHYTGGNNFIRKWNINTSLGLNLTYRSGSTSWQLGPQIRYQHLPTYSNLYPIKEYLMDYGVRLGFTKQIR